MSQTIDSQSGLWVSKSYCLCWWLALKIFHLIIHFETGDHRFVTDKQCSYKHFLTLYLIGLINHGIFISTKQDRVLIELSRCFILRWGSFQNKFKQTIGLKETTNVLSYKQIWSYVLSDLFNKSWYIHFDQTTEILIIIGLSMQMLYFTLG